MAKPGIAGVEESIHLLLKFAGVVDMKKVIDMNILAGKIRSWLDVLKTSWTAFGSLVKGCVIAACTYWSGCSTARTATAGFWPINGWFANRASNGRLALP